MLIKVKHIWFDIWYAILIVIQTLMTFLPVLETVSKTSGMLHVCSDTEHTSAPTVMRPKAEFPETGY